MPVEKHPTEKICIEVVTTILHAGENLIIRLTRVSGGLHGVGDSVVNAFI